MTEEKTKEKKRKRKSEVVEADVTMDDAPAAVADEEDEEARKQRKKEKKEKKRKEKEEAAKLEEQGVVSPTSAVLHAGAVLTWV